MRYFPFLQIDVFTRTPLAGNPCAVVLDADGLSDQDMLKIAVEMNLSETVYVRRSNDADFGLRYFTPAEEIPLAGHPTLAAVQALIDSGRIEVGSAVRALTAEVRGGRLPLRIYPKADGLEIEMEQFKPVFLAEHDPEEIVPLFTLEKSDLIPGLPIETVSTGTPQLMVPLKSLASLRRAALKADAFAVHRKGSDYFSAHLFCLEAPEPGGRTFARHFCAPPDVVEDPFTGSATGGMAAYLWRYNLIRESLFIAQQGHYLGRPGQARVEVIGQRCEPQAVRLTGSAVTCIRGTLTI